MSAKPHAVGHSSKHVKKTKAVKLTAKHRPNHHKKPVTHHHVTASKVHAKATHTHHAKAAGFAIGDLLPVCAVEALAVSLRLAGQRVSDDEVLELHHLAGGSAVVPVSVEAALAAAARFGLAGCRPVFEEVMPPDPSRCLLSPMQLPDLSARVSRAGLVLHVDVPGPHAVLATPGGWWSWGELWSPWPCRVEAAWAVSWI